MVEHGALAANILVGSPNRLEAPLNPMSDWKHGVMAKKRNKRIWK
jgi:hypothetical protein